MFVCSQTLSTKLTHFDDDSLWDADGFRLNYIRIWLTIGRKTYHAIEASSRYPHFSSVVVIMSLKIMFFFVCSGAATSYQNNHILVASPLQIVVYIGSVITRD